MEGTLEELRRISNCPRRGHFFAARSAKKRRLLRGIDVAILQKDVLDSAKQRNLIPHIESWLTYITTLYNEEFHLIARPEIKSISDLGNQKVSVDVQGAGTVVTAAPLFDLLEITVTTTNDD